MIARTEAAGRIIDVMTSGKFDWRSRLDESDFLNSADWHTALAYADAALSAPSVAIGAGEALARRFHEAYERLAPSFGYETRPDTKAFNPSTPNGRLMIAVCEELAPASASIPADVEREAQARTLLSMLVAANAEHPLLDQVDDDGTEYQSAQMAGLIVHAEMWLRPNSVAESVAAYRAALAARPSTVKRDNDGQKGGGE